MEFNVPLHSNQDESDGWFSIHRKLLQSPYWLADEFTRGQAWVDLIGLANHKDAKFFVRGIPVHVKRGQVGWSKKRLAERWKWSRPKVDRFLNRLESEQQIVQHDNGPSWLITLTKYDSYQANRAPERAQSVHKTCTNNNDNNIIGGEFSAEDEAVYNRENGLL